MRTHVLAACAVAFLAAVLPARALAADAARERSDVDERYRWNLADIYPDDAAWEADFERAEAMADDLAKLQDTFGGKLAESGKAIRDLFKKTEKAEAKLDRLMLYAGLKGDEDTRISKYQGYRQRLQTLGTRISTDLAWIEPELVAVPRDRVEKWLDTVEGFDIYRHYFDDLWRQQEHVLTEPEERILSLTGELASAPGAVYGQMMNADLSFGTFTDETGEEVEMTQARYMTAMKSPARSVREEAFDVYYDGYEKYLHAATAAYAGSVQKDILYTRARGYDSCVQRALDADNVPVEVLDNLIATINANFAPVTKYNEIRRRMLGVDTLRHWDTYISLVPSLDEEIPYDRAAELVAVGLAPLGDTYVTDLERGLEGRWIDVYENVGKRSGAYSWGSSAVPHPYMLLNYESRLDDVFTLAHELGHTMHTWYTVAAQPQVYADYSLFVAEVASTTNEAILMHHLLETTTDRERRIFLVNHSIQEILGTIYTQVMFAEFEREAHAMAERGEPLTVDSLNELYGGLLAKYGGGVVEYTERSAMGWCRIPHFYRQFYVYKYATSYAAALALADRILGDVPGAREAYLGFLKSGSSDYPIELLKGAGVDLSKPETIQAACSRLAALVDELDVLLKEA